MINQLLLIFSSVVIYEFLIFIRIKKTIILNLNIIKKIIKLIYNKRIVDLRNQKLYFYYLKLLLLNSLKLLIIFIIILIFILALNIISDNYLNLILSIFGVIQLILFFIIYNHIRKFF